MQGQTRERALTVKRKAPWKVNNGRGTGLPQKEVRGRRASAKKEQFKLRPNGLQRWRKTGAV